MKYLDVLEHRRRRTVTRRRRHGDPAYMRYKVGPAVRRHTPYPTPTPTSAHASGSASRRLLFKYKRLWGTTNSFHFGGQAGCHIVHWYPETSKKLSKNAQRMKRCQNSAMKKMYRRCMFSYADQDLRRAIVDLRFELMSASNRTDNERTKP